MKVEGILKGQVGIVTGASRGIGRGLALKLAELGADVAFNYHHSAQQAETLVNEIEHFGVKAKAYQVDVKDYLSVKSWIEDVKESFGSLDILINNAGIIRDKALMMMSPEDWAEVIDTNLSGYFNTSKACIVTFMKQRKGCIVNISSVSGIIGLPRQVNYSASKGGINALTKALAKEVASYGIRVNAVAPGFIETDILSDFDEGKMQAIQEQIPLGRIGRVADVANCVEYLLGPEAQYITGQIFVVDGGLSIQ